jgi:hypothetical protein
VKSREAEGERKTRTRLVYRLGKTVSAPFGPPAQILTRYAGAGDVVAKLERRQRRKAAKVLVAVEGRQVSVVVEQPIFAVVAAGR